MVIFTVVFSPWSSNFLGMVFKTGKANPTERMNLAR